LTNIFQDGKNHQPDIHPNHLFGVLLRQLYS
jgi:hypothetical protein